MCQPNKVLVGLKVFLAKVFSDNAREEKPGVDGWLPGFDTRLSGFPSHLNEIAMMFSPLFGNNINWFSSQGYAF
jgi:hypothetical protein